MQQAFVTAATAAGFHKARLNPPLLPTAAGGKLDRELVPGVKLKTENKKPIVGLAVHPVGAAC